MKEMQHLTSSTAVYINIQSLVQSIKYDYHLYYVGLYIVCLLSDHGFKNGMRFNTSEGYDS